MFNWVFFNVMYKIKIVQYQQNAVESSAEKNID